MYHQLKRTSSLNRVYVRAIKFIYILVKLSTLWGRFNKTVILLGLFGYEIIITHPTRARGINFK